ncbi:MAG: aldehyde dehydrogenase family protein [Nitriliruptoraceae bacterium]|nr:aldehyde dehydrogenase family protein [Nitriliruptoraceae bacterium]
MSQTTDTTSDAAIPPTPTGVLDEVIDGLRDRAARWIEVDVAGRIALLRELTESTLAAAPSWAAAAARAKGIDPDGPLSAEDWGSGIVVTLRNLTLLERTLEDIAATGRPQPPAIRTRPDGQVVVDVLPTDRLDGILYQGYTAEVRLEPGVKEQDALARMGRIYRDGVERVGGVGLVLGAGNVSSIGPMDALYELFARDRVVILKMNPVNEHLGPHIAAAFEPLVRAGFLRVVYGGAEVGAYLTDHPRIDHIHITGSDRTHDAIVFGTGDQGRARKERGEPRLDTPVTSELGNVTPVIVVPGPWKPKDLAFHGDNIATMLVNNAGFNCIASRVIVQHRAWSQRGALLDAVRDSLRRAPQRSPYYPGARERWETFTDAHRSAEWFGDTADGEVPFTLIPELDAEVTDDVAFTTEAFCGVMGEVALDAPRSIPDYLDAAVAFCNDTLWGTLAATIIVHPRSLADPEVAAAVERAIDELRYGSVVLNHFGGAAYAFVSPPWGAYPGSTPQDIQSGSGVVHNTYLLEDVQKTVVRGPFRTPVTPPWFHTHRTAHKLLPKVARFTATRDPSLLPGLLFDAARG